MGRTVVAWSSQGGSRRWIGNWSVLRKPGWARRTGLLRTSLAPRTPMTAPAAERSAPQALGRPVAGLSPDTDQPHGNRQRHRHDDPEERGNGEPDATSSAEPGRRPTKP